VQTITNFGSILTAGPVIGFLLLWLWRQNLKSTALAYGAIVGATCCLTLLIKYLIFNPEQTEWDHQNAIVSQYFPSGHTVLAILGYGAYALVARMLARQSVVLSFGPSFILISAIGYSRIGLVSHPWGDVVGGICVGCLAIFAWHRISPMNGLPARPITDLTAGLIVILAISITI
jgi:membrane-associated phospholipid phosphatase